MGRVFVRLAPQVNCESDMKNKIDNIYKKIDIMKDDLLKLSHDIHSNPEIKWEEFLAARTARAARLLMRRRTNSPFPSPSPRPSPAKPISS